MLKGKLKSVRFAEHILLYSIMNLFWFLSFQYDCETILCILNQFKSSYTYYQMSRFKGLIEVECYANTL